MDGGFLYFANKLNDKTMKRGTVNVFKALGDPNRIRVLKMLEKGGLHVAQVREVLDLAYSTVSKHLSILRDSDLIVDSKTGKWVTYSLNDRSDKKLIRSLLADVRDAFEDDPDVVADRKSVLRVTRKQGDKG